MSQQPNKRESLLFLQGLSRCYQVLLKNCTQFVNLLFSFLAGPWFFTEKVKVNFNKSIYKKSVCSILALVFPAQSFFFFNNVKEKAFMRKITFTSASLKKIATSITSHRNIVEWINVCKSQNQKCENHSIYIKERRKKSLFPMDWNINR